MKEIDEKVLYDLGISRRVERGQSAPITNCYHFCSDGAKAEVLFRCHDDYVYAMNRLAVLVQEHDVLLLAFCLMDNHFHVVLYGLEEACRDFIREFVRCLGIALSKRGGDEAIADVSAVSFKSITDSLYLKTVICYVLRNPPVGHLAYSAWFYPYSSCSLLFPSSLQGCEWCAPRWMDMSQSESLRDLSYEQRRMIGRGAEKVPRNWRAMDGMILPSHYVAASLVEKIFVTPRAYHYFMSSCRDKDMDEQMGSFSSLSIPDKEMRVHRDTLLKGLFPGQTLRQSSVSERVSLARKLKSQYGCPTKQIARLVGLPAPQLDRLL